MNIVKEKQYVNVEDLRQFLKDNICIIDKDTGDFIYATKTPGTDKCEWKPVLDAVLQSKNPNTEIIERTVVASYSFSSNHPALGNSDNRTTYYKEPNGCYLYEYYNGISDTTEIMQTTLDEIKNSMMVIEKEALTNSNFTILKSFKIDDDVEITKDMYEELKSAIWDNGVEAIDDLLGYEHNVEEDSDSIENRMDMVLDQMSPEEFMDFYNKYCDKEEEQERE